LSAFWDTFGAVFDDRMNNISADLVTFC
jgi:hypothetical protein